MKTKTVYSTATGQPETAYESPLEPGVFLMPANTTEIAPPAYDAETQMATWNGEWVITEIPQPEPEPEPEPPTEEELKQIRIAELKQKLRDTDYVSLPDYDKDKPEVLADRQAWRDEIRALEDEQDV